MSASDALTGNDWQSQLVHAHYQGRDHRNWSRNWYNQNHLQHLPTGLTPPDGAPDAIAGNVIKITAYAIDLGGTRCCKTFERMLTHQFVSVETDNRYLVTLEKNKNYVVVQSCEYCETKVPVVLEYCNGKKRKRRSSRRKIATDAKPKKCSILDIIKWICEKDQLKITYHIAEANCQHFASSLWNQFASTTYPIPAQYG